MFLGGRTRYAKRVLPRAASVLALFTVIGGLLGLWATFLITTQEPRIALQEDTVTLRTVIRSCAVASFCGSLLQYVGAPAGMSKAVVGASAGAWYAFLGILTVALGFAGVFVMWGELLYLRRFADRVPDHKLTKSTTLIMWVLPVTAAVGIVLGIVAAVAIAGPATPATPGTTPGAAFPLSATGLVAGTCLLLAFALYLGFWYVRLLVRYRKAFAAAAAESRAHTLAAAAIAERPRVG